MLIKIYWDNQEASDLLTHVQNAIEALWLSELIQSEMTLDENLKQELNISKQPALIIEEDSIGFKDSIFEGMVPEVDEIKSMLISIVWDTSGGQKSGGCSSGWCNTCATWCH